MEGNQSDLRSKQQPYLLGEMSGTAGDDLMDAYNRWKTRPDPRASTDLIRAAKPVIDQALQLYAGNQQSPSLRSRAKSIVLDAAAKYDPRKSHLKTHLMHHLQGLRRIATRQSSLLRAPEKLLLDRHRIYKQEKILADKLGRPPSSLELADATGLSPKRIAYVRSYQMGFNEGRFADADEEQSSIEMPEVEDEEGPQQAWTKVVYYSVSPRDQYIMEHSMGLYGQPILSNKEIARRLRLSPAAVSQRKARIQKTLDQYQSIGGA